MIIREIFRVLYSPLKAFEEIAKAPNLKGPLMIFLMTLLVSAGAQYISSSKVLLETEEGAYIPLTATELLSDQLILNLTDTVFRFFLTWLIYGAVFLLVLKLFRAKEGSWSKLFILIGYIFIVTAVVIIVNAILISTFPGIHLDSETWTQALLEGDVEAQNRVLQEYEKNWVALPAYRIGFYLIIVNEVWTAALGAVAIHFLREVSWKKVTVISAITSVISLLLRIPLIF